MSVKYSMDGEKVINLRVSEDLYFKFREVKARLKAETNEDCLKRLIEVFERWSTPER